MTTYLPFADRRRLRDLGWNLQSDAQGPDSDPTASYQSQEIKRGGDKIVFVTDDVVESKDPCTETERWLTSTKDGVRQIEP
jgi:hypothetical protein